MIVGVGPSIFLHLYSTSRPHVAIVGQIPGTTTFRNVTRHVVLTDPEILSIRVDASLYFPTARFTAAVAANPSARHVVHDGVQGRVDIVQSADIHNWDLLNGRYRYLDRRATVKTLRPLEWACFRWDDEGARGNVALRSH